MVELHGYKCGSGHAFSTAQQLVHAKEKRTPSLKLKRKISVSGNALVVRVPKDLAKTLKIRDGDEVTLSLFSEMAFLVEK